MPSVISPLRSRWQTTPGPLGGAGLVVVIVAIVSIGLSNTIMDIVVSARDGRFPGWLRETGLEMIFLALAASAMAIVIVPVLKSPLAGGRRIVAVIIAVLVAAAMAGVVRLLWLEAVGAAGEPWPAMLQRFTIRWMVRYGTPAAMLVVAAEVYRRETGSIAAMQRAELDRAALDREMAETRLQVLQAQIEPHFLFNTLANVRRLYQTDAPAGRRMLDNLMRYLEVALPRMRDKASTLGREAELIRAFLAVQQIRMGRRLAFAIDIAEPLRDIEVPPMMLLTLVENALKHGLNPLPEGGFVRIAAHLDGDRLVLDVADTGRGFGEGTSGGGTGLANIRARLAAMYGERASLSLAANLPRGVDAKIQLPHAPTGSGAAASPVAAATTAEP
jgi:sensor histidine kinase YesM